MKNFRLKKKGNFIDDDGGDANEKKKINQILDSNFWIRCWAKVAR